MINLEAPGAQIIGSNGIHLDPSSAAHNQPEVFTRFGFLLQSGCLCPVFSGVLCCGFVLILSTDGKEKDWKSFLFPFVMCSLVHTESFWMVFLVGGAWATCHIFTHTWRSRNIVSMNVNEYDPIKLYSLFASKLKTCLCSQQCVWLLCWSSN